MRSATSKELVSVKRKCGGRSRLSIAMVMSFPQLLKIWMLVCCLGRRNGFVLASEDIDLQQPQQQDGGLIFLFFPVFSVHVFGGVSGH